MLLEIHLTYLKTDSLAVETLKTFCADQEVTFSEITDDPVLGAGKYMYLSFHMEGSGDQDDLYDEAIDNIMELIALSPPPLRVIRAKIESILYDQRFDR